jgi:uncharacterized membrane protein (DUF373 family)
MMLKKLLPQEWSAMTFYQRFESVAAAIMTLLVSLVIVVAVIRLAASVISGLVLGALNPLDHKVFQGVFGDIVIVMIALEFNRSLQYLMRGKKSIFQTQVILLIALLAVARKFIIMDLEEMTSTTMAGLAAVALALGIVYRLLRDEEGRPPRLVETLQQQKNPDAETRRG